MCRQYDRKDTYKEGIYMSTLRDFIKLKNPLILEGRNTKIIKGAVVYPRDVSRKAFSKKLDDNGFKNLLIASINRLSKMESTGRKFDTIGSTQNVVAVGLPIEDDEYDDLDDGDNVHYVLNLAGQTFYILPSGIAISKKFWIEHFEDGKRIFEEAERLLSQETKRTAKKLNQKPRKDDSKLTKILENDNDKKEFFALLRSKVQEMEKEKWDISRFTFTIKNNKEKFSIIHGKEPNRYIVKRMINGKTYGLTLKV